MMKQVLDDFEKKKESDRQQLEEQKRRITAASVQDGEETGGKNPDKGIFLGELRIAIYDVLNC